MRRIIADAKPQSVFGSLKVIISSNSNTKLVNISIDYVGRSRSHLIILTYNLHIPHNLTCLLILHPRKSHQAAGAHRRRAPTRTHAHFLWPAFYRFYSMPKQCERLCKLTSRNLLMASQANHYAQDKRHYFQHSLSPGGRKGP